MELSINPSYLLRKRNSSIKRSCIECIKLCKDAGFRLIDFDLTASPGNIICFDDWKERLYTIKEQINELSVNVDQAHAPFEFNNLENHGVMMGRAFEACKILGVNHLVIHADIYDKGDGEFNFDDALRIIYDFYAPFVEYAKKENIGVAIENLFETSKDGTRTRFTSNVEEQLAIINKFNDSIVTACWDFGHARVTYGDNQLDALKKIGGLLSSTHVHDNIYGMDLHQNVFLGGTNWEEIMKYLKESKYKGNFTYELVYGCIPDDLLSKY
ncbi:MAG: sugar phosphate isomerase/epimerase, partial [Bacillota bacterium]|nr:sugar phosphate isomerase/epimerase [Bacillota bacterium]